MKKYLVLVLFFYSFASINAQCVLICNQSVNYALDNEGNGIVYPDIIDAGSYNGCVLEVALYDEANMVELVPYGDTIMINCDHLGNQTIRLRDTISGSSCWGNFDVADFSDACVSSTELLESEQIGFTYSQGILNVDLPEGIETEVHISNIVGKRLFSQSVSSNKSQIDMSILSQTGVYIATARINGKLRSKKIIVW